MKLDFEKSRVVTDRSLMEGLWKIYTEAFEASKTSAAQDQLCYNRETFLVTMDDDDYWKFVLLADGSPVGFALATNNLVKASVTYVNPGRLRAVEPEFCAQELVYYFTAIAILPEFQKQRLFGALIEGITLQIDALGGHPAWDVASPKTAQMIHRATLLAQEKHGLRTRSVIEKIGAQEYYIQRFTTDTER